MDSNGKTVMKPRGGTGRTSESENASARALRSRNPSAKKTEREILLDTIQTPDEAITKLVSLEYMMEDTVLSPEKLVLMVEQTVLAATSKNVMDTPIVLKALSLLIGATGIDDMTKMVASGVIDMITGEEVAQAMAHAVIDQMWEPMEELKKLRDDLVEWNNVGGTVGGLEGFKADLKSEMRVEIARMAADSATEMRKAGVLMEQARAEIAVMTAELKGLKAAMMAPASIVNEEVAIQEGQMNPVLWHTRRTVQQVQAATGDAEQQQAQEQGRPNAWEEKAKAGRTLNQKQAIE
ncbi:hypothetical protein FIBSPDRAFT_948949 [Athelia psychrophila]|uniref:Uncharacterized protein n=1 Tax=Athelia psychrophila TaxID=1759441 RepID=A0A166QC37_9AGAM|nr:hypothetical protein FIBSPDRAFT_948949 [Fibularhizoctonia sp. CBS 109695]